MADALRTLYPQIVNTIGDLAYDANGEIVEYDQSAVVAKQAELEAQAQATKASALAKLTALGLTQDEVKALLG